MKVLSLFDGLGGARLALKNIGVIPDVYYASEIDKYSTSVCCKNFPDVIQIGNILNINVEDYKDIDLLIGGSPCTQLSKANQSNEGKKGLYGKDSQLLFKYFEILKSIKPKYFILENVASMKDYDRNAISFLLNIEPIEINSSLLTAQNRKRYYWTNIPDILQPENKHVYLKDILENKIDSKYILSNREVEYMNKQTSKNRTHWDFKHHHDINNNKSQCITSNIHKGVPYNVCIDKPDRIGNLKGLSKSQANRIYSFNGKSVTLTSLSGGSGAKTGLYTDGVILRKLTPIECERLQGINDNYTAIGIDNKTISDTQRYKMIGNGFTIPVIEHLLKGVDFAN